MKAPRLMRGEELRREAKRIDRALGAEIDRLRMADPQFKSVLDRSLEIEDEVNRRKNHADD